MKKVPVSSTFALVDDQDYERVIQHTWYVHENNGRTYAIARGRAGARIRMHHLIVQASLVDHIDGNGLNNTRENLRSANISQNAANSKKHSDSKSQYKGVSWSKNNKKWQVQVTKDYKHYHLGFFESETDAAKAYDKWAVELHGEFAKINFPSTDKPGRD